MDEIYSVTFDLVNKRLGSKSYHECHDGRKNRLKTALNHHEYVGQAQKDEATEVLYIALCVWHEAHGHKQGYFKVEDEIGQVAASPNND